MGGKIVLRKQTVIFCTTCIENFVFPTRLHVTPNFNPLNAKLNPICHLLALLGAHHIPHVSRIRVNKHKSVIS